MFTTDITPNDFDDLALLFARLDDHLSDMTLVFRDLGELLMQSTQDRFDAGLSPEGMPWAPKSLATMEAQRRREGRGRNAAGGDPRPLHGPTGKLSSEIFYQADAGSVEIGSGLIYAGVHQFGAAKGAFGTMANGSPIPWGDIPARPFLGISAEDRTGIEATLHDWLEDGVQTGA